MKSKIITSMSNVLVEQKLGKAEAEIDLKKTEWLMENHKKLDEKQWDNYYRLESILDIDISGKDLLIRLDLDVPLSPYTPSTDVGDKEENSQQ